MTKSKSRIRFPRLGQNMPPQAPQQNQSVAGVTKQAAEDRVTKIIENSGIPPERFVEMGQLCEAALQDPKQYPAYVKYMVDRRLETPESMAKPDYQMMASQVVMGRIAQGMISKQPAEGM